MQNFFVIATIFWISNNATSGSHYWLVFWKIDCELELFTLRASKIPNFVKMTKMNVPLFLQLIIFSLFHIMIHDSFWRIIQSFQEWRRTKFLKKEKEECAVTFWLTCNHCPTNRNILKNYPIVPGVTKAKILWKWQRRMCHHILVNIITNSSWKSSVIR